MGQVGSSVLKTMAAPFRNWQSSDYQSNSSQGNPTTLAISPYVYKRRGSQYLDEDGQLAHEFYELKQDNITDRICMTKLNENLVPQGEIELPFPRLHIDLPVVLCEAKTVKNRY